MSNKPTIRINEHATGLCEAIVEGADTLRVEPWQSGCGTTLIDFGVKARGGLAAGRALAEVCLSDLGEVDILPDHGPRGGPAVTVTTDHPIRACMASQYAGWQISHEDYFAMGSGPMRAAAGKEELFETIGYREKTLAAVGVLESNSLPPEEVCLALAKDCGVRPEDLTLLVAPTTSMAGTVQIVARSVETTLHKLHELKFDLSRVQSGFGSAPLPPPGADQVSAIGRTNDAILYGGEATLWVTGDDASLEQIGPQIPSCSSPDFGEPFATIFRRYDGDFYQIDPRLFSPARVTLINLETGKTFRFGQIAEEIVRRSFEG